MSTEQVDAAFDAYAHDGLSPELARRIVQRQMNRSGNTLLSAMEPLSDDEFFGEGASGLSAAWTVGHLACVADLFASWLSDRKLRLSSAVHSVFNSLDVGNRSPESKAASVDRALYPKGDIILMYRQAQIRALTVLGSFDLGRWNQPAPSWVPDTLGTPGAVWEHLAVHVYWHLGELSGSLARFHGTYTLNTVLHYFYPDPRKGPDVEATPETKRNRVAVQHPEVPGV